MAIDSVTDSDGNTVETNEGDSGENKTETEQVVPADVAVTAKSILSTVVSTGTGHLAATGDDGIWGKTGTTDDTRDAWFVGYTPTFLALVWVGYDDNSRTGLTGASGALPIWVDFMRRAGFPGGDLSFPEPEGVVHRTIDPETGGLAVGTCPTTLDEVFVEGTEPEEECPLHGGRGVWRWFKGLFE